MPSTRTVTEASFHARLRFGRRLTATFLGLCAGLPGLPAAASLPPTQRAMTAAPRFVVYYGRADDAVLAGYDLVVLDADVDAALLARRAPGATFLGYVSLGEIHAGRDYFAQAQAAGVLIGRQPRWPDAWFVDMRAEAWRHLVLERIVPAIVARGFDGIFLDTLDDAEYLETTDPAHHGGMVAAAAGLVHALRRRFPTLPIMINRGYAVLPHVAGQFDMLLGESVRATHDADRGTYLLQPERDYAWQRDRMWEARRRDPTLRVFSLDYWNPEDAEGIARLYAEQRHNGFIPYVATPDLTRIVPRPAEAAR